MQRLRDYTFRMENKKGGINKVLSIVMTALIIGLLVFVGPVDAYYLQLSGLKTTPYIIGEKINFLASVEINTNERVPIKNVSLEVNDEIVCVFDIFGNNITSCEWIEVDLESNSAQLGYGYGYNSFQQGWHGNNYSAKAGNYSGYGYGYGYGNGPGELVYNISIQTPRDYLHFGGNNRIKLITTTETQTLNSRVELIVINPSVTGNGNFLLGTENAEAIFWGRFNSSDRTLAGEVQWLSNPSINMIGVGNYNVSGTDSGTFRVRFYHNNGFDEGMVWDGVYGNGRWNMTLVGNNSIMLDGRVFLAPN